jgi:hypothetical protein
MTGSINYPPEQGAVQEVTLARIISKNEERINNSAN